MLQSPEFGALMCCEPGIKERDPVMPRERFLHVLRFEPAGDRLPCKPRHDMGYIYGS